MILISAAVGFRSHISKSLVKQTMMLAFPVAGAFAKGLIVKYHMLLRTIHVVFSTQNGLETKSINTSNLSIGKLLFPRIEVCDGQSAGGKQRHGEIMGPLMWTKLWPAIGAR